MASNSSTSRKPRSAARSASRPATSRRAAEPDVDDVEVSAAEAQEVEADSPYVTATLDGEELQIIPPGQWRQPQQRLLNLGQVDAFAEQVIHPDDLELFFEIDPTNAELGAFVDEASRVAGESLGETAWTRSVVEAHAEAVEADLLRYYQGVDLLDVHRGGMSWRRLRVLLEHLPPESATWTALRNRMSPEELAAQAEKGEPEKGRWSQLEQLIAANVDAVRRVEWVLLCANIESKSKRPDAPEPMRRPGAGPKKKSATLTAKSADTLFELIQGGAA